MSTYIDLIIYSTYLGISVWTVANVHYYFPKTHLITDVAIVLFLLFLFPAHNVIIPLFIIVNIIASAASPIVALGLTDKKDPLDFYNPYK